MEYISRKHVAGGMSRVVHILARKLGSPLSCITPAKYDAKGVEARRWFILDGLYTFQEPESPRLSSGG
jgi:hypothetical protein